MGSIYQLTFFLALGLLAIVITIFVFAVSLLGRAMEAAATSEKQKLAERKKHNAEEMRAIRKEIEEAEAKGQIPRGLIRKLKRLEKKDRKFEKELTKARRAPELLTVKGGVVPCTTSLLAALILTGAAWYLSTIQTLTWIIPVLMWIASLAAISCSISRIYQCLKVIESVAVTSEEEAERRLAAAVKVALKEVEEERKPELELEFISDKLPLRIEPDSEKKATVSICLSQGNEAIDVLLYIAAPPGFDFPGMTTFTQHADHPTIPNYVTTKVPIGNMKEGIDTDSIFRIKAPAQKKTFLLYYRIVCSGFDSGEKRFKVVVK